MADELGYTNIKVYTGGHPAWSEAGNVLLTNYEFVSKELGYNIVAIDTRDTEVAEKGHVPGAVSIPLERVISEKNQLPVDKEVYIVLYSQETNLTGLAPVVKEIIRLGYHHVFVLDGGYSGWLKKGGPVQTGKIAGRISYNPDPRFNEITVAEFLNTSKNNPAKKLILDVRTKAEASAGKVENAINIPVEDLKGRIKELPKDKEVITYSETGLRAKMAYILLRNAGYKTRFLKDNVTVINNRVYCGYK
jgi:rhodanese-related sulfurtransferase